MQTALNELKWQLKELKPDKSVLDWGCPIINAVFEHCVECSGLFKSKPICNNCIIRKSLIGEEHEPEKHEKLQRKQTRSSLDIETG